MDIKTPLLQAWPSFWVLTKHRPEPAWARLLISTGIAVAVSALLLVLIAAFSGQLLNPRWWRGAVVPNLLISLSVTYTVHALYRSVELGLPEATIARIVAWRDWRSGLFFSLLGITGTLIGGALGVSLIGGIFSVDLWASLVGRWDKLVYFLLISALLTLINWVWWQIRWRQQALQLQATEAQLRLLQAQIEPHFLFNTLATVHSLMDQDTGRARRMLESFTDYLRAGLGQLRSADATLAAELAMAEAYLQLMQARMDERLRYRIEAPPEVRLARLPPLLLQPLIENAIRHGLEPKLDGGRVTIGARLDDGRLRIEVADDGLGLASAPRPRQPGAGLALDNIRARLQARYGDAAALRLEDRPGGGAVAILTLPFIPTP